LLRSFGPILKKDRDEGPRVFACHHLRRCPTNYREVVRILHSSDLFRSDLLDGRNEAIAKFFITGDRIRVVSVPKVVAREMFGKSYFSLGVAEKMTVDQTTVGIVAGNYQALTPEALAGQKTPTAMGFLNPNEKKS